MLQYPCLRASVVRLYAECKLTTETQRKIFSIANVITLRILMEKKLPTIKEIARRLNISISTVSRALHDHPSIGLRTKIEVKKLAEEMNYEPNQTAIFFKQRKTFTLGVLLPNLREEYFSLAISGI